MGHSHIKPAFGGQELEEKNGSDKTSPKPLILLEPTSGIDIYLVKELLGHSDLKLTARYAHVGQNSLRAAVKRLGDQPSATPSAPSNFVANLVEPSAADGGKTKAGGRS